MRRYGVMLAIGLGLWLSSTSAQAAGDPSDTIRLSELVLNDLVAIPGKQIPHSLLADAAAVAIIPDVTKIGFIAGVRRGHGVVLVRDPDGEWSLPQFLTLTGGSVGWQAGIQGTDVVLVFRTKKGVDGLMSGKFTIGVDAAASAGPVGRNAEAATDNTLKAEILSYSRSRGLFLGVSLDGSALEIDHRAHYAFYGSQSGELPARLPESAVQLRQSLADLTPGHKVESPLTPIEPAAPAKSSAKKLETLRRSLVHNAGQLHALLSPSWQQYLAVPKELLDPAAKPNIEALKALEQRFAKIEGSSNYKDLSSRAEFQVTAEVLREYLKELTASEPAVKLPPPPE